MASNKNDLLTLIANNLPDNNTNFITPALVRTVLQEMVASDLNLEELTEQQIKGLAKVATLLFDIAAANPAPTDGLMFYDQSRSAISHFNDQDILVRLGQASIIRVNNTEVVTMTAGSAVRPNGAVAGESGAKFAIADTTLGASAVGLITKDVAAGQIGYVTFLGLVQGIDTDLWSAGDTLYVSDTTPGELTNVEPCVPNIVGVVLKKGITDGEIFVTPSQVADPVAIGQSLDSTGHAQALTTTPVPAEGFSGIPFEKRVDITATPSGGSFRAIISPTCNALRGNYWFSFSSVGTSSANVVVLAELYINGSPTGLISQLDLINNNVTSGQLDLSAYTEVVIDETDQVEVYLYTAAGTTTWTTISNKFNGNRMGL